MKILTVVVRASVALSFLVSTSLAAPQTPAPPAKYRPGFHFDFPNKRSGFLGAQGGFGGPTPASMSSVARGRAPLPLWSFYRPGSRDPYSYPGFVVGSDPFHGGDSHSDSKVPTYIVPIVVKTHKVGTGFITDSNGNIIGMTTAPGNTTFDPTQPDVACLGAHNNVPIQLVKESPLFQDLPWKFGGTNVGRTQYIDAFQRASFWKVLGGSREDYHVRFAPVQVLPAVVLDVPPGLGSTFAQYYPNYTPCAPTALIDINYFDNWLDTVVLPALAASGVDPNSLPVFAAGNVVWGLGAPEAFVPLAAGYHSFSSVSAIQTYAVSEVGTENFWTWPDTYTLSHELGEWVNDPYTYAAAPAWGNIGQVTYCQTNFEVGDPLTGTFLPPVTGANGFNYSLQELAFFSWFYGSPSAAVNGWFSNNGTFLDDAGPICE